MSASPQEKDRRRNRFAQKAKKARQREYVERRRARERRWR